jgi:hypothetical protein
MPCDIFISYRRIYDQAYAGRLFDRLEQVFGRDQVFIDVDAIEPGLDFASVLGEHLQSCKIVLAIIGPQWLNLTDTNGRRRLENPDDFVRVELKAALARDIRIIPVLVDGADMPSRTALPTDLGHLATRQAVRLTHERFATDVDGLIKVLSGIILPKSAKENPGSRPPRPQKRSANGWSAKWSKPPSMTGWSMVLTNGDRHHVLACTLEGFILNGKKIADQPLGFNIVWHFKIDGEAFKLRGRSGLFLPKMVALSVGKKIILEWKDG